MEKIVIYVMQFVHCASTQVYQADFQKCIIRKILYNFISDLMLVTIFQIIAGFQFIIGLGFFIILQSNA